MIHSNSNEPAKIVSGGARYLPWIMQRARNAQAGWAGIPLRKRLQCVAKLRSLIAERGEELAQACAIARSRSRMECLTSEVIPLAEACRFLQREAEKILAPRKVGNRKAPLWLSGVHAKVVREPHGVISVIGPGNYPLLLAGVQVIQALVAGNAVFLKPGEGGSACAHLLAKCIYDAGIDPFLLTVLDESLYAATSAIAAAPDKVVFTGSANTGRKILESVAGNLTPTTMELSGMDAAIVCEDADIELAAKALWFGMTLNGGATCMAPRRVFVVQEVASLLEQAIQRIAAAHKGIVAEPPANPGDKKIVPFAQESARTEMRNKVRALVGRATQDGAKIIDLGIGRTAGEIDFPVFLTGVESGSALLQQEHFYPVTAIVAVQNFNEAVQLANSCSFGLGASIFSKNITTARKIAEQLRVGVVTINDMIVPTADARLPFGGRGQSGYGVTRGSEGLLEMTRAKVVTETRGTFRPAFQVPKLSQEPLILNYLQFTHGGSLSAKWRAVMSVIQAFCKRNKD